MYHFFSFFLIFYIKNERENENYLKKERESKIFFISQVKKMENIKQKKKTIPKALRMKLWEIECGNTLSGSCFACHRTVKVDDFQAGHIISEANGGLVTLSNLKVVCKPCNTSCGTMDLHVFKDALETNTDASAVKPKTKKSNKKSEEERLLLEETKKAEEEKLLLEETKKAEEAEKEKVFKMVMAHSTNEFIRQYPPVYIKHEDSVRFKDYCKEISEKKELFDNWMTLFNARDRWGRKISVFGNKLNGYAEHQPTIKW